jgi:hypothetical protein
MTKSQTLKAINEFLDKEWKRSDSIITSLLDNADHPAHAKLIQVNKGIKLALEDVNSFIVTL